jgi:signal transduction histidine kinase/CheY-like chemotaxis protein
VDESNLANLEDLRIQLIVRLAMLLIGTSSFIAWSSLVQKPFSITLFVYFIALLGLGIGIQSLLDKRPVLAQHLLVWGLTVGLLAAMWLFPNPWLPFLGLLLIFIDTMLIAGSEWATAGLVTALAAWLKYNELRFYSLPELLVTLALGGVVAWLTVGTLYAAMQWLRTAQQKADRLLDEVRDQRAELSGTLKSAELANAFLYRTQRELIEARKAAEEARLMKEQFAANISHELRTPLNLIMGFSEVMYLSPQVYGTVNWPRTLRRDVYHIYHSSRHLVEMINDILDLSRFEMTGFSLNKESTPLETLLKDTVEIFRNHPVQLETDIAPNLPILKIDRTRIRQVLLNLLNNAQRFTMKGTVQLAASQIDDEILIRVSDTGLGIPEEKLPHIFDEFYQVDHSLTRSHQGAGLGLAISKRFIEAHGGRIWVESQEGIGTRFFFTLPINPQAHVSSERSRNAPEPQWPQGRPRILVLDPDPGVPALMKRYLEEYDVLQVENADQLSEAVMLHHPQVVVRNVPPNKTYSYENIAVPVPVIDCSLPSHAWITEELAIEAFLTKPITSERLLSEIERIKNVRNILIIDDDRGFFQLIQRLLAATGRNFKVSHAYDGEEGLVMMRMQRPDLVLLDMVIPGHSNGIQTREQMRQDSELADIPIILLTAASPFEDILAQSDSKIVVHRSDGLQPDEILSCLHAVTNILKPHYDERAFSEVWLNKDAPPGSSSSQQAASDYP